MDRLETMLQLLYKLKKTTIYIPVWIDQKREKNRKRHNK